MGQRESAGEYIQDATPFLVDPEPSNPHRNTQLRRNSQPQQAFLQCFDLMTRPNSWKYRQLPPIVSKILKNSQAQVHKYVILFPFHHSMFRSAEEQMKTSKKKKEKKA